MLRRLPAIILLLSLCLTASACTGAGSSQTMTPDSGYYAVDPVFREFYNFLGGREILGEVISPAKEDGVTYQYTVAGLLVFDSQAAPVQRFQLGPLAVDFGIPEPASPEIRVGESFQPLYDQLGGQAFVGKPLTEMAFNKEKNRTEQYFENLGFYQGPETDGHVRLLPYGAWSCGEECRSMLPANAAPLAQLPTRPQETAVIPSVSPEIEAPQVIVTPETVPSEAAPETIPTEPAAAPEISQPAASSESHRWSVKVSEAASVVSSLEGQVIRFDLQRDSQPFADVVADLLVTLPDGSVRSLTFPATGLDGSASVTIEPIQAENGTTIPYEVCILVTSGAVYCVEGKYTIWTPK